MSDSGAKPASGTEAKPAQKKKKVIQLGDFRLVRKLGQGGMGEVYLANQVSLDRKVALKILSKEMAKKPGFTERFVREARAMARIDHPAAVKIYAAESDKGLHYVAIEYVKGTKLEKDGQLVVKDGKQLLMNSMQDWMDQLGKVSVGDAIHIILECADALQHAHELSIVHRDIKPDNVLVTDTGKIKVADFGLAKAVDDEDMSMTQSGTGLGTPLYMPPEQARDAKNVDLRTDIYALGVTFYYLLTGKLPFKGDTVLKLIMAKENGQFDSMRKLNPEVPERLELIVDKMIQKEPKHRYADCGEIIAALEELQLESESLSFISTEATSGGGAGRGGRQRTRMGSSTAPGVATSGVTVPGFRTSQEDALAQHESQLADVAWYVQFSNAKGERQVKEMTTRQVQQGIRASIFDVKANAQKKDAGGGFLPLAAYPEFQDLVKKRLVKEETSVRKDSMKDMYAKIDKEQRSRKRWRWLKNTSENVLGGFGLIVYLIIVAAVLFGAYWGIRYYLYPMITDQLDEANRPDAAEQAEELDNTN